MKTFDLISAWKSLTWHLPWVSEFIRRTKCKTKVMTLLPHRGEALILDEILPDPFTTLNLLTGIYRVPANPLMMPQWLKGHFPGKPIMPGAQIEEMAHQIGIVLIRLLEKHELDPDRRPPVDFLLRSHQSEFHRPVFGGQTLLATVEFKGKVGEKYRFKFKSFVQSSGKLKLCAEGEFLGVKIKS